VHETHKLYKLVEIVKHATEEASFGLLGLEIHARLHRFTEFTHFRIFSNFGVMLEGQHLEICLVVETKKSNFK
jgi:hypothetical protein